MIRAGLIAIAFCALAASPASRQGQAVFHADARLVVVHVSVHDRQGEPVTGLDRGAFEVYENGARQPVALFRSDEVPVSLGMVIDNSSSMRARRAAVETAALAFARVANPLDEAFVVNFADTVRLDVPITRDHRLIESGLARIDAIGGTALRDAVEVAAEYLNRHATHDRKALLVISDGDDNASTASMDPIRRRAGQDGIAIYALALPHDDPAKAQRGGAALDDLAEHTGGVAVHVGNVADLDAAALRLAREIRRQYTLAYTPSRQALDGSYRKIRVVVKGREKLSVRARAGYYATPAGSPRRAS